MTTKLRLDFPPEVVLARDETYARIRALFAEQTEEGVLKARQLHLAWLKKHPDDYIALDAGEVLAMTEDAYQPSGHELEVVLSGTSRTGKR